MKSRRSLFLRVFVRLGLGLVLLVGLSIALGGLARPAYAAKQLTIANCRNDKQLQNAITTANKDNAGDTITFKCSGVILLSKTLTITGSTTLNGSGQTVTLDGNNSVKVLSVSSGVSFTLNALTIAHGLSPISSNGGGLENFGTVSISNSTFANNSAISGGGLYNNGTPPVTIGGSIVANNTANNCAGGGLSDQGYNLESGTDCGFMGTGDLQNTDPMLNGLGSNGGPTQTMALQQGSLAIDHVPLANCPSTDQRGNARPDDSSEIVCDIGAYESSF